MRIVLSNFGPLGTANAEVALTDEDVYSATMSLNSSHVYVPLRGSGVDKLRIALGLDLGYEARLVAQDAEIKRLKDRVVKAEHNKDAYERAAIYQREVERSRVTISDLRDRVSQAESNEAHWRKASEQDQRRAAAFEGEVKLRTGQRNEAERELDAVRHNLNVRTTALEETQKRLRQAEVERDDLKKQLTASNNNVAYWVNQDEFQRGQLAKVSKERDEYKLSATNYRDAWAKSARRVEELEKGLTRIDGGGEVNRLRDRVAQLQESNAYVQGKLNWVKGGLEAAQEMISRNA